MAGFAVAPTAAAAGAGATDDDAACSEDCCCCCELVASGVVDAAGCDDESDTAAAVVAVDAGLEDDAAAAGAGAGSVVDGAATAALLSLMAASVSVVCCDGRRAGVAQESEGTAIDRSSSDPFPRIHTVIIPSPPASLPRTHIHTYTPISSHPRTSPTRAPSDRSSPPLPRVSCDVLSSTAPSVRLRFDSIRFDSQRLSTRPSLHTHTHTTVTPQLRTPLNDWQLADGRRANGHSGRESEANDRAQWSLTRHRSASRRAHWRSSALGLALLLLLLLVLLLLTVNRFSGLTYNELSRPSSAAAAAAAPAVTYRCIGCQLIISDNDFVQFDRARYHPGCVQCEKCRMSLPEGFTKVAGRPYCAACANAAKEARGKGLNSSASACCLSAPSEVRASSSRTNSAAPSPRSVNDAGRVAVASAA